MFYMDVEIKFCKSAFKHGETEEIMPDMTEEEYDALDELWTKTTPQVGPNGTGFISRRNARLFGLDDLSMDYLLTKSMADHKAPADIIGEMVRERVAASA